MPRRFRRCESRPSRRRCARAAARRTPARSRRRDSRRESLPDRWRRRAGARRARGSSTAPRTRIPSPGPGERMSADHLLGQSELAADVAHFVLEQLAQRLDELELHPGLQAADVVMRLDRDRRTAARRVRLDHVRVQRSLHQELVLAAFAFPARRRQRSSNTSMNVCPMIVRFFSGSSTPSSVVEEDLATRRP